MVESASSNKLPAVVVVVTVWLCWNSVSRSTLGLSQLPSGDDSKSMGGNIVPRLDIQFKTIARPSSDSNADVVVVVEYIPDRETKHVVGTSICQWPDSKKEE